MSIPSNFKLRRPIGRAFSADDTCIIGKIRAINTGWAAPECQLVSGDDLEFDSANGVADTTIGVSGVMDLTNASYNTIGEVALAINASANWRWAGVGCIPSDTWKPSALAALAHTAGDAISLACVGEEGTKLLWDTSGAFRACASIGLEALSRKNDS